MSPPETLALSRPLPYDVWMTIVGLLDFKTKKTISQLSRRHQRDADQWLWRFFQLRIIGPSNGSGHHRIAENASDSRKRTYHPEWLLAKFRAICQQGRMARIKEMKVVIALHRRDAIAEEMLGKLLKGATNLQFLTLNVSRDGDKRRVAKMLSSPTISSVVSRTPSSGERAGYETPIHPHLEMFLTNIPFDRYLDGFLEAHPSLETVGRLPLGPSIMRSMFFKDIQKNDDDSEEDLPDSPDDISEDEPPPTPTCPALKTVLLTYGDQARIVSGNPVTKITIDRLYDVDLSVSGAYLQASTGPITSLALTLRSDTSLAYTTVVAQLPHLHYLRIVQVSVETETEWPQAIEALSSLQELDDFEWTSDTITEFEQFGKFFAQKSVLCKIKLCRGEMHTWSVHDYARASGDEPWSLTHAHEPSENMF